MQTFLFISFLVTFSCFSLAQTVPISGVINEYTSVSQIIDTNTIVVGNTSNFNSCDKVIIMQMKGATIDVSNTSNFGSITNYNYAGSYEMLKILSISGNQITFNQNLLNKYNVNDKVQLIRVPVYSNALVNGLLTCQEWNDSTGGVIAIEVDSSLILNADIDVSGKGFKGGITYNTGINCPGCNTVANYFYPLSSQVTAQKGESIFLNTNVNYAGGRGANANGGGAGNCKNGGGGGGSNGGAGGIGGKSFNVCSGSSPNASGIGGYSLTYSNVFNRIFLGGGGGGGDEDDIPVVGTSGEDGGGIIVIISDSIIANGYQIKSNGTNAATASTDGAGGGGGGGAILLKTNTYIGSLTINVNGGEGGDNTGAFNSTYCVAPGGGGSGGVIWFANPSLPSGVTTSIAGGQAGIILNATPSCTGTSWGATAGGSGSIIYNLLIPDQSDSNALPNISLNLTSNNICVGDTLHLYSDTIPNAVYQWTGPNGFTSNLQNPIVNNITLNDTGTYYLTVSNCFVIQDSIHIYFTIIPTIQTTTNAPVCVGDTIKLFAGFLSNVNYSWTGSNGYSSSLQNPVIVNSVIADSGTYTLILAQNGCNSPPYLVHVFLNPLPVINAVNSNSPLCIGDTLQLSTILVNGATYSWTGPGGFQSNLQNPVINNVQSSDSGNYFLTIQLNGCNSLPDSVNVIINATLPTPAILTNTPVCVGDTLHLSTNATGNVTYHWFGANNFQSTSPNPSINNVVLGDSGYYFLIIQVNGCLSDTAIASVSIIALPSTPLISSNSPLCEGDTLFLSTPMQNNITYTWTGPNGFASSIINPFIANAAASDSGNYFLTIQNNNCKSLPAAINITIATVPSISLSDIILCEGDRFSVSLPSNTNTNYSWNGPIGFTSTNVSIAIDNIDITSEGIYIVTAINGCGATTDSLMLTVNTSIESAFIPNCFTPNSDGKNDDYKIDSIQQFTMLIYNRWGQLLVKLDQNKNSWNGTFSGKSCAEGVYFYLLTGNDCNGNVASRRGTVTIIR